MDDIQHSGAPPQTSSRKESGPASPIRTTRHSIKKPSPPQSPQTARKRHFVTGKDEENVDNIEDTPTDSRLPRRLTTTGYGSGEPVNVCLCQPEPKIPRPRNAFILYRQHHQQAIVARNPGIANPDISKIIGEQWNSESPEQKLVWQRLAQEEKAKHQEQYPDYRYQPRRPGKPGSSPLNPSGEHTTVDKYRCPKCGGRSIKTPTSPFTPAATRNLPPPVSTDVPTPTTRYLPMSNLSLESPAYRRRAPVGPSSLSNIQVPSPGQGDAPSMLYSPGTPDSKRRRYNYPPTTNGRSVYYPAARRDSLPALNHARPSPPNTGAMQPPPRTPRDTRRMSLDLSVHVPSQHDQSRSVEAMVMSVPYIVKVRVLGRITPPLKEPGPTSPAVQVRGAIIAIEGDEPAAIETLAEWLKDDLDKTNDYKVLVADPPKVPKPDTKDVTFVDYLDLIKKWHGKSKEMIQYITTPVATSPVSSPDSNKEKDKEDGGEPKKNPVILLPTYQLNASNAYTSRIPITDAYSPTDHWQWMATLWRGTVGPDLTIYIRDPNAQYQDAKESAQTQQGNAKLVELNEDVRCLTVRKERGVKFEAAALRRVGFEVGEWIRDVTNKAKVE
ncbi:uncharacterized protein EI97DRAFT_383901 [Westerdykella ornata]|uniref:HMG box domain-containing protein n=1 Tax=Westerdykella ornata TaxID=318751 RepID=A0A6A6JAM4_WESOR|nr:uncharacterized protein EI97DRAFT_383901 [Westerdykella ornata]KAF2273284.1 hypothetical protein EI97DRAFT_383901 [Westerdykella ornata]